MSRDVYGRPPPRHDPGISRRALFGLGRSALARADVDYDGVASRVRDGWERDGHEPLLRAIEPVASVLVEAAEVGAGWRVLDAAAGDGNVAVAALARGARVDACDFAVRMVERGRARCPGAAWSPADVQALPYDDASFDAVLSSFGAALAPRARRTAAELVRVVRPGGVVALTAWVPRGLPGRLDELVPLPDGVRPPSDWGVQAVVRRRLEPLLDGLELRTRTVRLSFPDPDAFFAALLRPCDLDAEAVRPALDALLASCNDAVAGVEVGGRYLLALGRRR
jgi:SAM-dependent methyltransferase